MSECLVNGCHRKDIAGYGLCGKHYSRLRKTGDPDKITRKESVDKNTINKQYPREYKSYCSMKTRCLNKNYTQYKDYGGRGIKICDRWLGKGGFECFVKDMGPRPNGCSLDRIDNNGDYCPKNCRWSTSREQSNNTRTTVKLTYGNDTKTLSDWSRVTGIPKDILYCRSHQYMWPVKKVLTHPYVSKRRQKNFLV